MQIRRLFVLAALGTTFNGIVALDAMAQGPCAPPHRMQILDLDMYPDPVHHEGQPVQRFTVTVQADRKGECLTAFEVRDDGNQVAGRALQQRVRPGTHKYTIPAVRNYRFQRQDHCFQVVANIANNWTRVDAAAQECARRRDIQIQGWTLDR